MLDVVEAYVSRWKMKFNSRKRKVMVVVVQTASRILSPFSVRCIHNAKGTAAL